MLVVAKLFAWWIALGSGTSGGTLAPLLLISGGVGSLIGSGAAALFPGANISPGAFALVAMAATFGASVRATFTAIVFCFELTRDYEAILPLMLASVLAQVVAGALLTESLMTQKLARRGLRVASDYEADILGHTDVGDVMTTQVDTLPAGATVADARRQFERGAHGAYPIVDEDGRCVAIIARHDLLQAGDGGRWTGHLHRQPARRHRGADHVVAQRPDGAARRGHRASPCRGRRPPRRHVHPHRHPPCPPPPDRRRARPTRLAPHPAPSPLARRRPAPQRAPARRDGRHARLPRRRQPDPRPRRAPRRRRHPRRGGALLASTCSCRRPARTTCTSGSWTPTRGDLPDDEAARANARRRLDDALASLSDLAASIDGEVGDADPLTAIRDALGDHDYDEIIISTLPAPISRWLHLDLPHRVEHTFHLPVTHLVGQ